MKNSDIKGYESRNKLYRTRHPENHYVKALFDETLTRYENQGSKLTFFGTIVLTAAVFPFADPDKSILVFIYLCPMFYGLLHVISRIIFGYRIRNIDPFKDICSECGRTGSVGPMCYTHELQDEYEYRREIRLAMLERELLDDDVL